MRRPVHTASEESPANRPKSIPGGCGGDRWLKHRETAAWIAGRGMRYRGDSLFAQIEMAISICANIKERGILYLGRKTRISLPTETAVALVTI